MTVDPAPERAADPAPVSADPTLRPTPQARWAVGLAAAVVVVVVVACALLAVAYAVGGSDAISDNWIGFLGAAALLGGLPVSLAAWVLAVVARVKHEQGTLLWLPLSVFPILLAVVVLAEALWLE